MDKLISYPKKIDEILKRYKDKTGVSVTQYIRKALIKQMILDGLIEFEKETFVEKEDGSLEAKGERYCDSASCELAEFKNIAEEQE